MIVYAETYHSNVLGTNDRPCGGEKGSEEAFKPTEGSCGDIFRKSTGFSPVSETIRVALRIAANHGDKGEEE